MAARLLRYPRVLRTIVSGLMLKERVQSGVAYNPLDRRYHQDPYPTYRRLRDRDPVHRSALGPMWVLTRYRDVDAVLRDHGRYANNPTLARGQMTPGDLQGVRYPNLLVTDPPDHTRLRTLVAPAFTRSAIEAWRPRIERAVDELLDAAAAEPAFDLMEAFANPLPVVVIAEMLGVPREDFRRFKRWSDATARLIEFTASREDADRAYTARDALRGYLDGIVEERVREPREDLISVLAAAQESGDRLSRTELLSMLTLLLIAGNETTSNLIGNGTLALLRDPEQAAWLRAYPERVDDAVEELVRFDSPVQADRRVAKTDLEIDGRRVRRGEQVVLLLGAANRDPEQFPGAERLDLARGDKSHVGFGRGIHHCLGAPLARLEAQLAFPRLLERFPALRLAEQEPRFKDHIVLRGLERLPVRH